ncbi:MAG: hypothetical protein NUV65_04820 [Candidatus Roizmanbacteria bacterium]|nr:hypothetical protein [Candidatus Roizmanbacteria bacterium]
MAGKKIDPIITELITFGSRVMSEQGIYPYVSFIVKRDVIVARGYNMERESKDVSQQGDVVAIRNAQNALETGDLSGYCLYSLFEPTILGFDVALWSGVRDFVWCINSSSLPKLYNKLKYSPLHYANRHPKEITIQNGIQEKEALQLVKKAKEDRLYPDNLL